jgi:hypothetical protein
VRRENRTGWCNTAEEASGGSPVWELSGRGGRAGLRVAALDGALLGRLEHSSTAASQGLDGHSRVLAEAVRLGRGAARPGM